MYWLLNAFYFPLYFFFFFFERQPEGDGQIDLEWLSDSKMIWFQKQKRLSFSSTTRVAWVWALLSYSVLRQDGHSSLQRTLNPESRITSVFLSCAHSYAVFCAHRATSPAICTQNSRLQLYCNQCQVPKLSSNKMCISNNDCLFFPVIIYIYICRSEWPPIRW